MRASQRAGKPIGSLDQQGSARDEPQAIRQAAAEGSRLDDSLVLPHPLGEQHRPLQEAMARLHLDEGDVVVLDRQQPCEEEPAAEPSLSGTPPRRQIARPGREGHAQERTQLAVDALRAHGVRPDDVRCCGQCG